jgi:hypothetical protein
MAEGRRSSTFGGRAKDVSWPGTAGDETRTRDIQLGRKDATARAVRVFKEALDASMAHFLWLANVLF